MYEETLQEKKPLLIYLGFTSQIFCGSKLEKENLLGANNVCYNISVHVTSFIHGGGR